jgi:Fur family transcriptional regulator, zinc uptake regulator
MAKATHKHFDTDSPDLADAAREAMIAGGEQWTDMRGAIFAELARAGGAVSAYDIADSVSKALGRRVAANTVYRILDLFVAKNVAGRVESRNAYIVNAHPGCRHDCIYLVCDACGGTTHVDDDLISAGVRGRAEKAGFRPLRPVIEVRGRCAACA